MRTLLGRTELVLMDSFDSNEATTSERGEQAQQLDLPVPTGRSDLELESRSS